MKTKQIANYKKKYANNKLKAQCSYFVKSENTYFW